MPKVKPLAAAAAAQAVAAGIVLLGKALAGDRWPVAGG